MNKTVILDLDGTVADCSHRVHLAQAKQWDEFHSLIPEDQVIVNVADTIMALWRCKYEIVVATGRPEKYRDITRAWLKATNIGTCIKSILMRPDHDWSPDHEVKLREIEKFFGSKEATLENVLCCFEDRDKVAEAMRNYGLTVFQVAQGTY
jgi:hypothetical protein